MKKSKGEKSPKYRKISNRVMQFIFILGMVLLVLFIGMGTVIPELNRHKYEGVIVEKYRENHGMTTGTTQFIELKQGDRTIKIENSDILLHGKWNSLAVQKDIREDEHATVYTIGFDVPSLGIHPNLYRIEQ
ncbi:hypothetical protein [Staphylococcus intermedius]|uniref:Phage protein n=1 Tax=Staphylococcus intermedius NCTC 11048 TaxID=1141106 RepID=A0A380G636_STAIN|nr:hypothetical protein [Staphylococcus intermedius]PCF63895.1 hypothetical protein B5C04_07905 [Staphylococcus intermedius]PCF78610.1 hypothetical protein B4W74_08255 [Staphylococcus intermedius]PCF79583.1 hypothetical protein B4W70_07895 [Staphylococcus intermedius]PCF86682.1 hypothetical protein B4W76_06410 [Staphylococcus intermedius]PCF89759.1 hypothetical protein B4W75_02650 [Staphylococcus intermedius]